METEDSFKINYFCLLPEGAEIICPVGLALIFLHLKAPSDTNTSAKPSNPKLDLHRAETKRNAAYMPHNCYLPLLFFFFFLRAASQSQVCSGM